MLQVVDVLESIAARKLATFLLMLPVSEAEVLEETGAGLRILASCSVPSTGLPAEGSLAYLLGAAVVCKRWPCPQGT